MTDPTEPVQRNEKLHLSYHKTYTSFNELKEEAAFILLGHVTQQWVTYSGPPEQTPRVPWTHSRIHIEQSMKGALAVGGQLEVRQLGGPATNGAMMMAEEYPLLLPARRYILFLNENRFLIPPQGVYVIDEHNEVNSLTPQPVREQLGLSLSIDHVPLDRFIARLVMTSQKPDTDGSFLECGEPT